MSIVLPSMPAVVAELFAAYPQVPALLSRSPTLLSNPFFALRDAYITTNSSLHTRSDFSDELCGTTAASILVSGTTL